MPYTLLEFRGKQGNSPLGEAPSREKRQFAAFRPKNNFVGQASRQQKRPSVARMSLGIYDPQVSRAPRSSELFVQKQVFVLSARSRQRCTAACRTQAPLPRS